MFPFGHLNTDVVGRDAAWIAGQAGLRVTPKTRVLIAPFEHVVDEEVLTHEKLSPVLGMTTVADAERGIRAARAVVRIGGVGHSAAIHSETPSVITDFAAQVPVLRVSVNVGNSTGSTGLETNLRPVDDAGHRLRRPQLARREPATAQPDELDANRLQQ